MDTLNSILKFIGNKLKIITDELKIITDKYTTTGIVSTCNDFNIDCTNLNITGNYLINGESFGYKEPIDITSSIHSTNGWTATNDGVAQFYLEPQGSANECAEYYKDLTIDVYVGVVRTYKGGIGVSTFPIVAGHVYKRVYNSTYIDQALVRFYEFNR